MRIGFYAISRKILAGIARKKLCYYIIGILRIRDKKGPVTFGHEAFNINICCKSNSYFNFL